MRIIFCLSFILKQTPPLALKMLQFHFDRFLLTVERLNQVVDIFNYIFARNMSDIFIFKYHRCVSRISEDFPGVPGGLLVRFNFFFSDKFQAVSRLVGFRRSFRGIRGANEVSRGF